MHKALANLRLPVAPDRRLTSTPLPGYRPCVGMVVCNQAGEVLLARRIDIGSPAWQFPQGGIDVGETPRQACARELLEETGLRMDEVDVADHTPHWLAYDLPAESRNPAKHKRGQVQAWFLLRHNRRRTIDLDACLAAAAHKEFDQLRWASPSEAVKRIVWFKADVYSHALRHFARNSMRRHSDWAALRR